MASLKIQSLELILEFSERQLDTIDKKPQYLARRLKQNISEIEGVNIVLDLGEKFLIDIDQPDKIEEIKKKVLSTIIKILG